MRHFIIIFLTILTSYSVKSQDTGFLKGYIITDKGDTLTGLIKNKNAVPYRVLPNIKFKQDENSKVTEYSPVQLKGFTIGQTRYLSNNFTRFGETAKSFMELIIDDDLMLLEYRETQFGTGGDLVYKVVQRKKDGSQYFFSTSSSDMTFNFKTKISEYLKDNPTLCEKIKSGTYKKKHIIEIVKEYNDFIDSTQAK
jgi:hypothetical protein